jgi:hypothetical protein
MAKAHVMWKRIITSSLIDFTRIRPNTGVKIYRIIVYSNNIYNSGGIGF